MEDRIGQQFGHYHLIRHIGKGSFADVYLGEHQYLEVPAAIKVLHVDIGFATQDAFRREARTIAHLQHPHIVRVLDFGFQDQTPYLVMEYTPRGTLRTLYPKGTRLSPEQVIHYVKQIAQALDFAHGEHIIHRDVKPENLLLNDKDGVLLSDFGIAVVQHTLASLSEQKFAGTPLYTAPEQIRHHACPASDQYAVAIMVYEWLCGKPPFQGALYEVLNQHLSQPPPSLCARVPELPLAVDDAIFGALAKDPEQRFPTVLDFVTVLEEACFSTQVLSASPPIKMSSEQKVPPPQSQSPPEAEIPAPQPKASPERKAPLPQSKVPPEPDAVLPQRKASPMHHAPPSQQPGWTIVPAAPQGQAILKQAQPVSVMCICARPDQPYLKRWEAHLRPLEHARYLTMWSEYNISAGSPLQPQIDAHMDQADLIILLLSADFFSSAECTAMMERAFDRYRNDGVRIVPLLLSRVEWRMYPIGVFSCLPSNEVPVTEWPHMDTAFDACARDICTLLGHPMPLPQQQPQPVSLPSSVFQRNRKILLRRVRSFWIDGVLNHSLHGAALLALGLGMADQWDLALQHPDIIPQVLPAGTRILQVYTNAVGELLILGAPGSGKTTLLLELANDLLRQAEQNEQYPVPVVFNLSSWALKKQPLVKWLAEELVSTYQMPRKFGQALVEADHILPLLDGLDEVAAKERTACIQAINKYREKHVRVVVSCRSADYLDKAARVEIDSALVVQPLTPRQVMSYLASEGARVEALHTALQRDPDLQELATTPLMLNTLILAYQGIPLKQIAPLGTLPDKQKQIFDAYVQRMLLHTESNGRRYSPQRTIQRLSWLARQLSQRNQTVFYSEHLQPDWLPSRFLNYLYLALVVKSVDALIGLLIGILGAFLITGFVSQIGPEVYAPIGLMIGLFTPRGLPQHILSRPPTRRWFSYVSIGSFLAGLIMTSLVALFILHIKNLGDVAQLGDIEQSATRGAFIGLVIGILLRLRSASIQPIEVVSWSWRRFVHINHLYIGLFVGLSIGLLDWWSFRHPYTWLYAFFWAVGSWFVSGLLSSFSNTRLDDSQRIVFNQGILHSARNGRRLGCLVGLSSGFIYTLVLMLIYDSIQYNDQNGLAIFYGTLVALEIGLLGWLFSGGDASIKHRTLRWLLWISGRIPWRLSGFLNYAEECTLLCRVGGGYIFTHRLLLDYFASLDRAESSQSKSIH